MGAKQCLRSSFKMTNADNSYVCFREKLSTRTHSVTAQRHDAALTRGEADPHKAEL